MKLPVNGINLEYTDTGKGVPVILIHAFPLGKAMWADQAGPLSETCRVITIDLRGFGGSDAPPGPY
ncbi:MAG: alpha/beta fold hydrolase, partial [Blastocatellia bacterium]